MSTVAEKKDTRPVAAEQTGYYITPEELEEWRGLTDPEEVKRAAAYRKGCKKQDVHPTPPSKWIKCPACSYRTPGSLVSHIKTEHGGLNALASQMGVLPEEIEVVTSDMMDRFKEYGARSATAVKKNGTTGTAAKVTAAPDLEDAIG